MMLYGVMVWLNPIGRETKAEPNIKCFRFVDPTFPLDGRALPRLYYTGNRVSERNIYTNPRVNRDILHLLQILKGIEED